MTDGIVKAVLNHFEDTIRLDFVAVVWSVGVWIRARPMTLWTYARSTG